MYKLLIRPSLLSYIDQRRVDFSKFSTFEGKDSHTHPVPGTKTVELSPERQENRQMVI